MEKITLGKNKTLESRIKKEYPGIEITYNDDDLDYVPAVLVEYIDDKIRILIWNTDDDDYNEEIILVDKLKRKEVEQC